MVHTAVRWQAAGAGDRQPPRGAAGAMRPAQAGDSLPYRLELWTVDRTAVEAVLALASNGSIGYAAFYAALKDHPDRHITLSLDGRLLTQSSGPAS